MVGLSNELTWADAQLHKDLFDYTYFDSLSDFTTRDGLPVATDVLKTGLGLGSTASGATLCATAAGCVFGGPMAVFGAGNTFEGGQVYTIISGLMDGLVITRSRMRFTKFREDTDLPCTVKLT
ncbi:hypothetical protein [Pseudomonas sp. H3_G09]